MPTRVIHLDHAATSPLLPEALEAMRPWLGIPANPSSVHASGRRAAVALEDAREDVAGLLGRDPAGVVFCSGATEANHAALHGLRHLGAQRFAVGAHEHPSVAGALEAIGAVRVELSVDPAGRLVVPDRPDADAVVCMAANHETGVLQPVEAALRTGLPVHVDATHAAGRTRLALEGAATVAISAHKLGGPVGVGALSLASGAAFPPWLRGGAQERGRRAGTPNVAGAVGFAAACRRASATLERRLGELRALDATLREGLAALGARPVGDWSATVAGTTCFVLPGRRGETVVQLLDLRGVAVSSGAACASGSIQPSPVLVAMGDPEPRGGVRVSLGPETSLHDVQALLSALAAVARIDPASAPDA